ncbi:MAG TPA: acyltransferase [Chthoniobacterales bacterium]|jgi:peptidoglycan/LPS O-acetylase OafA/YrhL
MNAISVQGTIDRWSALSGVRFLLASIVVFVHMGERISIGSLNFIADFGGFEAVLGFLLVSGYSVTSSYLKQPEGFLRRRLQRLYPVYLVSIALTWLVVVLIEKAPAPSWGLLLANVLFLNQIVTSFSFVLPAWSLSLEFWLYCLAPFLIGLKPRWSRIALYGSFACYLAYTACRSLLHFPYHAGMGYGVNLFLLAFLWIAGLRLAKEPDRARECVRDIGLIFAGHIAFISAIQFVYRLKHNNLAAFFREDTLPFVQQALTLGFVFWVFTKWVIGGKGRPLKRSPLLQFLGDISYPLYLVHIPAIVFLKSRQITNPWAVFAATLMLATMVFFLADFYTQKRHPLPIRA